MDPTVESSSSYIVLSVVHMYSDTCRRTHISRIEDKLMQKITCNTNDSETTTNKYSLLNCGSIAGLILCDVSQQGSRSYKPQVRWRGRESNMKAGRDRIGSYGFYFGILP